MRAKIKFNQTTKKQAVQLLSLLENAFTQAEIQFELVEINFEPASLQSLNFVYSNLKFTSAASVPELILLDWRISEDETSLVFNQHGRLLCNVNKNIDKVVPLTLSKVAKEFINKIIGWKANGFAKNPIFSPNLLAKQVNFYQVIQKGLDMISQPEKTEVSRTKKFLIIDQDYELWIQVDELHRIRIPLGRGWEKALFFYILKNENGFSFQEFKIQKDGKQLSKYYTMIKANSHENDIQKEIIFRIRDNQFGKFFSPHFSRVRNKISMALGAHPDLEMLLNVSQKGEIKNILWDRNSIIGLHLID